MYCKVNFTSKEADNLKNKIQELRKEKKVTQQELADALSVTRQTIISLENGKYNASLTLAHKAAQFFGITIEELFIFEGNENI
jgi:putative transcriptional regulator